MSQVNSSFGSGRMTLALNEHQFALFIQFIKNSVTTLPILKAASIIGLQPNNEVWVVSEDMQINIEGNQIPGNSREYVWLPDIIAEGLPPSIRLTDLIPQIKIKSEFDRSLVKR